VVTTTQVLFLISANYEVDFFLKIPSPVKPTGIRVFSKLGGSFFFLMKIGGGVLPPQTYLFQKLGGS
jgi:hypothetical protein